MALTKAQQIKGLRKALKNKKTPKQFIPGMKKRLAKLTAAAIVILALLASCGGGGLKPVFAQSVPYQQTLVTGASCTGSPQTYKVNNRNLNQHYVTIIASASTISSIEAEIDALVGGNAVRISDQAFQPPSFSTAQILVASGYYPQIQVSITCSGTGGVTYSIYYSGIASGGFTNAAAQQTTQLDKFLTLLAPANATASYSFQTPLGSAAGFVSAWYGSTGPAGSTLTVACAGQANTPYQVVYPLATTANVFQTIPLPAVPCINVTVTYTSGGASSAGYSIEYLFSPPGTIDQTLANYSHITGTTATSVRGTGPAILTGVFVNTAASGTISIFDLASVGCTGTPATNTIAVITVGATGNPFYPYNLLTQNGICVKASAAMDLTVAFQ